MDKKGMGKRLLIFSIIVIVVALGFFISAEDSESATEWWMFGKYLNHTAWDGSTFTVIPGLNYSIFTTKSEVRSSPAVANGYVYVGGIDHYVYQLNASNLSQQIANFTTGQQIYASPAVVGGYVYVHSRDNYVYQLNASNISIQVANFTEGDFSYGDSSPAIANGYVYVGGSTRVYQLNATNVSKQIANFTIAGNADSSPAIANGYVYVGGSTRVYQLNASNISIQAANFTTGNSVRSSPAVANGYVYIGSWDNNLYQLNASNISIQAANFTAGNSITSSPAIANGYVYIGSDDKKVYQLNASNISVQVANYATGGSVQTSPMVANGFVYIGSADTFMYQLNASDISQLFGRYYTGGSIYSSAAYAKGYIYFGSNNYNVYQVNATNITMNSPDGTPPIVLISSPISSWTYSGSVSLIVSLNEQGYCTYSLDGGITNRSFTLTYLNLTFMGTETLLDGSYLLNVYCNDTAGNRNDTANVSFTMYTAPLQGGGGGSTTTTTATVPSVPAGEPTTVTITNPNIEVGGVTITSTETTSTVSVTVTEVPKTATADFVAGLSLGKVYQALNITVTGLNNSQIANATVNFRVNMSWIEGQKKNVTSEDILLFRRNESGMWGALATTYLHNDSHYYYYSAITPGFSTFVIFYGRYDCEPGINRCFESQIQMCLGNATWLTTEKCAYGCGNEGVCFESVLQSKTFYTVIIALVSAGIVITIYYLLARVFKKKRK